MKMCLMSKHLQKNKSNRCKRASEEIKVGNLKFHIMASVLQKMLEMWQECKHGSNSGPALKELERLHGASWWNNKVGG